MKACAILVIDASTMGMYMVLTTIVVIMVITIMVIWRVDIRDSDAIHVTDDETVRRGYRLSDPYHRTGVRLWPVAVYEIARDGRSTILRSRFSIPARTTPYPSGNTLREVQKFVDYVTGTDAWKALGVGNAMPISVRDGRGRRSAGADPYLDFITMPKLARSRRVALHELAHIAETYRADWDDGWRYSENENGERVLIRTTAPHGPEFAGIYLYLVRSFLSEEDHDRLKAAFKERRVKVAPVDRRCLQCGMVLVGSRSKFCSEKCRWTHHNHLRTARAEQSRQKICVVCGVEFRGRRVDAKTCSPRCRKRLSRRSQ